MTTDSYHKLPMLRIKSGLETLTSCIPARGDYASLHDRFVFTDGGWVVDVLSNDSRFSLWTHSEPVKDRMQMRQSIYI